ncbi:hypothetical protein MasN3_23330 [Massilia varians]|uniref:Lipoprotein n=1 Tax=Massilia varians TaxID=457921 RepID=A0ABM8C6G6_9BURK|nr:hypothetical protein [Massilia varians]BDT58839.1 hypothetical protein MasN3_23330 [Massilia varians]
MRNPCAPLYCRLAKFVSACLLLAPALVGCATGTSSLAPEERLERLDQQAMQAAVADGLSTGLALSAGALEMNPLVPTSPAGLIVLTGAKIGLVKYADRLPEDEKRTLIKTSSSLWTGAAVNNLMVLLSAPSPAAIAAGIVAGVLWWQHSVRVHERVDREMAARRQAPAPEGEPRQVAAASVAPWCALE